MKDGNTCNGGPVTEINQESSEMSKRPAIQEDVWIRTQCARCYADCAIRVRRVNGVAVKIEGDPDTDMGSRGGLCAKGLAALQVLYDPNRINVPLRRTNPEKGLHADPKWKEISWEEALDEIADRMKKVLDDDPRKLQMQYTTSRAGQNGTLFAFKRLFGDVKEQRYFGGHAGPYFSAGGGGLFCGQGAHEIGGLIWASWSIVPEFERCNYAMFFGSNKGTGSGHSSNMCMRRAAQARVRGMKTVVFDPQCNFNSSKADEWVPIIPGTDLVAVLAMCNVIVNELGIWDEVFLKTKTNSSYLIKSDGRYIRDKKTDKPLVWDNSQGKAVVYDAKSIPDYATACTIDYALEGEFEVDGIKCQPAFQLLKEHLKQYTPEMASEISTIPADTLRRLATEFAQAAQVGSTITIDGHQLPFRPASAIVFRGGQGHENSYHTCYAIALLNLIVGSCDVPGGTVGWPARGLGYPDTGKLELPLEMGKDGLLEFHHFGASGPIIKRDGPWPVHMPENHHHLTMTDIFAMALQTFVPTAEDREELWAKNQVDYRIEMLVSWGCNTIMSLANPQVAEDAYKEIPFTVVFELFSSELAEGFADILLPDTCFLEESNFAESIGCNFNYPYGMEDWYFHIMQPVVEPQYSRRNIALVMWEVAKRMGLTERLYDTLNTVYNIADEYKIEPGEDLTTELVCDRVVKTLFGPEHDWDWFKEHGFVSWPKQVEEAYWRYFVDCRVPIYSEFLLDIRDKMEEITMEIGIDVNLNQYTPLTSWFPCSIHAEDIPEYDLYCYSYRDTLHTGSHTMEQPWLDEASLMNPYTYNITINRDTASSKGIKDGDLIEVESPMGYKVTGTVKTMEGQHPLTMGMAACSGHWGKGMPIAHGKGTNFNTLLSFNLQKVDPIVLTPENCVRV
ncbi:molybdopterin-dependent oxidoreductase, partial [Chloroflexota bacterium]